ncbi:hypothetical protein [Clostridium cylindrosporum]|uniref:Uncharacterized protein n=1 Tax=Clostridium cylindrosporum DSM 605 TaxID=1121307 RepID=A0A0J8D9A1_CLOCY|nr:hypothetical protein [Clostridium cylindrosporum]KMT22437.1 hypothetical protein CLCY_12c00200 [Clostridium cylindrosporum DSM 605]
MSKYTLRVRDTTGLKGEIKGAVELLKTGDCLAIFTDDNTNRESILNALEGEDLSYKYKTEGNNEYILAKKDNNI